MPTLRVAPLETDKPKIVFYGAMMAIQNFGFFLMYFQLWPTIPAFQALPSGTGQADCQYLRFWVGFFALDCFVESFCCVWMAMFGYTSQGKGFAFGWVLHLLVALPYCVSTVGLPVAIYSDAAEVCRAAMGPGSDVLVAVYWTHCGLFLVYVWMMLSITYFSFLKPTFITKASPA